MKTVLKCAIVAFVLLLSTVPLTAQNKPIPILGGFENQGSVTAGYRFTDISKRREKYYELLDLRSGFRVNEFDLFGRASEKGNGLADTYSVNASGLGGDPYPRGQLTMSKAGL